jgi:hypothetical protein
LESEAILVRVPAPLKREIELRARENDRSLSQEVRRLLAREFAPREASREESASR